MKVTPDDPRLSAYLLGELPPEEAAVIKRAAAADPAIKMSLSELEKTLGFLNKVLGGAAGETLLPAQREAIRQAGRDADSIGKIVPLASAQRSWKPWLTGLGAAAAVAFAAVLMSRVEHDRSGGIAEAGIVTHEIALLPMPGPSGVVGHSTSVASRSQSMVEQAKSLEARPGGFLSEVARHLDRAPLPEPANLPKTGPQSDFSKGPATRLPVVLGFSSLRWVSGWVREKQQLPPRDAVRVEELINNAVLPGGMEFEGMRLSIETMKCPWNPDSWLVGVQLKGGGADTVDLEMTYEANTRRRVLGSFSQQSDAELPRVLPAKRRTLSLLEVKAGSGDPGRVVVRRDGKKSEFQVPSVQQEPSFGMRHAAGLAGFGMWLRGEGVGDDQLRSMLAAAAADKDPVRAEVRRMMAEALKLAHSER
ncbi:von Willebrand factor type A domain-containing protein [Haloferula chungangensis]|uniref:von Willebrand factor type A domain-containing protein n=1 Tax=Haloferula chungangensis TaxID=1048331 RepID=A0ABW2L144_9BACT